MPTWPARRGTSGSLRPLCVLVSTSGMGLLVLLAELREHRVVLERGRVAHGLLARGDVAQEAAHDLAAAGLRQRVGETDVVGPREGADLLRHVLLEGLFEDVGRRL